MKIEIELGESASEKVLRFLKNNKNQLFSKAELKDILRLNESRLNCALKNMVKNSEILFEVVTRRVGRKIYGNNLKRYMRLFYLE